MVWEKKTWLWNVVFMFPLGRIGCFLTWEMVNGMVVNILFPWLCGNPMQSTMHPFSSWISHGWHRRRLLPPIPFQSQIPVESHPKSIEAIEAQTKSYQISQNHGSALMKCHKKKTTWPLFWGFRRLQLMLHLRILHVLESCYLDIRGMELIMVGLW